MTDNSRISEAALAALPWTAKLRAMGYKGSFDIQSMSKACAPDVSVDVRCGDRPEEALGRHMIEHPELWRK